jgi:hypothetical protein
MAHLLQYVLYIPKLMVNLFSLTKAISTKGVQLSSKGQIITLQIGKNENFFDIIFQHGSGQLLGIKIHPNPNHIAATAHPLDINKLHTMFGHPNSQVLAATVSKYGFITKNTLEHTCPNCAICKVKQKNPNKLTSTLSNELGGRINIDISSVQTPSYGCADFWILIQDDFTGYLWSYFIKAKSDLPDSMFDWLQLVKKEIFLDVKCISLDNSGENYSYHDKVKRSNYNIKFEFTAPAHHNKMEKWNVHLQQYMAKVDLCLTQLD